MFFVVFSFRIVVFVCCFPLLPYCFHYQTLLVCLATFTVTFDYCTLLLSLLRPTIHTFVITPCCFCFCTLLFLFSHPVVCIALLSLPCYPTIAPCYFALLIDGPYYPTIAPWCFALLVVGCLPLLLTTFKYLLPLPPHYCVVALLFIVAPWFVNWYSLPIFLCRWRSLEQH